MAQTSGSGPNLMSMFEQRLPRKLDAIVFDFDGTVADSFDVFLETVQEVLGRPPLAQPEIDDLRGSATRSILRQVGVRPWQIPGLLARGRHGMARKIAAVKVVDGIPDAMRNLAVDHRLYLLSSNSQEAIRHVIDRVDLDYAISGIYAGASLFGKAARLTHLLDEERISAAKCAYVGDETRDIEAAKQVGAIAVAVEWGYNTARALSPYDPDILVAAPNELVHAIRSFES
jgi:phosphoglycolate phosphatase